MGEPQNVKGKISLRSLISNFIHNWGEKVGEGAGTPGREVVPTVPIISVSKLLSLLPSHT